MRIEKIQDSLDLMAGFELTDLHEQKQTLLTVIDTLCGYPKPKKKYDPNPTSVKDLGAYLFVSNSRNACKLGELGFIDLNTAQKLVNINLETALSLLLD